ncbi:MAG: VWA domain-containing protein [Nitrospirae bacterium]|nr:VWA domain-containing protein [Nitrospirota bacterium]
MIGINKKVFFVICIALVSLSLAGGHEQDNISLDILAIGAKSSGGLQAIVNVHDERGKSIHGLKVGNFALTVGDKKVNNISLQKKHEEPLSVIIAVDVSGSMSGAALANTKTYVSNLLHQLSEDNHVMLVTFGSDIKKVVHFTLNRDLLYSQLDGLKAVDKKTIMYQAVIDSITMASSAPTSKTAILVITDGRDEHSHLKEKDFLNTVEGSYIPIYTIALGKSKHTDAIKKISDVSGGYFLISPNYDEVVQLGKIISGIVDVKYALDFELAAPAGKHTGVVYLNYMGKELTAQKEFNISATTVTTTDTAQTNVSPGTERASIFNVSQGDARGNWTDNRLMFVLLILIVLFAISNILLIMALLRRSKLPFSTNDALQVLIKELNGKIDVIRDTVSVEKPDVPFGEIVYKLDDVAGKIKAVSVELRELPKEAKASCGVKEDISPILGRLERGLAEAATVTGMLSGRLDAMDTGMRDHGNEIVTMIRSLFAMAGDKYNASLEDISKRFDTIETGIAKTNNKVSQQTEAGIKDIANEVRFLRDSLTADKADSSMESNLDTINASFNLISGRLDEIETFIAKTNNTMRQRFDEQLREFSQTLQSSIVTSVSERIGTGIRDLNSEIISLTEKLSDIPADKVEDCLDKVHDSLTGKMEGSIRRLYDELTQIKDKLSDTVDVSELSAKLEQLSQENGKVFSRTVDAMSEKNAVLSHNLGGSLQAIGNTINGIEVIIKHLFAMAGDKYNASLEDISKRFDTIETGIAKTNNKVSQQTEAGIKDIANEVRLLRDSLTADKADSSMESNLDTIKASFNLISGRLDEIETFIAKTNNTMRQRSDEQLREFSQTLQSSIVTSVSERIGTGIRDLNSEIISLTEKLSDIPTDKVEDCLDKVHDSLTGKIEGSIRRLYDELTQIKDKLPDTVVVSGLSEKLEQLSQESGKVFSRTVDAMSEKNAVLSHNLGDSLQAIGNTINDIEVIIKNLFAMAEDKYNASLEDISKRFDTIETGIAKTNNKVSQQTEAGIKNIANEVRLLRDSLTADKADSSMESNLDTINASFNLISGRLDEIETFIAKTNNTMRQRSDEQLREFSQTLQSSIVTSVSEKIGTGIRDLNSEIISLTEKLSDIPADKVEDCLDKVHDSLTGKMEGSIRRLYDELTQIKDKLPDTVVVLELSEKLEQLSQESGKVFSRTVDVMSEKNAVLSHNLGDSLQAIGNTINGIEVIIKKLAYNLSEDSSGSVKVQVTAIRETIVDIIKFLLLLSEK